MLHNQLSTVSAIPQSQSVLNEVRNGKCVNNRTIPKELIEQCLQLEGIVKHLPHLTIEDSNSDHGLSYAISRACDYNKAFESEDEKWKYRCILEVFPRFKGGDGTVLPKVVFLIRDYRWMTELELTPVREVVEDTFTFDFVNKTEKTNHIGSCMSPRTGQQWNICTFYHLLDVSDLERLLNTIPE